ncbi:MAG: SpoIIE family protein phosphatase [Acidobacteriota bacterium]|nr:SpoIIE family protein phosphatase [Acidobacteriota bacterium]
MNSNAHGLLLHLVPEDPEPLRDQIVRQLRGRVVRGELSAGELLPGHRQLARRHRVAPSTVEAAYEMLVAEGLLTGEPEGDVRVAEVDSERRHELVESLQLERLVAQELGRRELEMARDVQRRLLPPSEVAGPGWEVVARCLPARVVAGDFYDVLRQADGSVDVVVADVAGKGFAASLIMASVKAMLPYIGAAGAHGSDSGVAELLVRLNQRLVLELGRGEFVALTVARYHPVDRRLELANAGAPDPYLMVPGRPADALSVPGPRLPLGVREEVAYASRTVTLGAEDRLLLLTDGLPEARDATGEPLGYGALETMLSDEPPTGSSSSWLAGLFDRVQQRSGRTPEDDWTAAMLVPRDIEVTS